MLPSSVPDGRGTLPDIMKAEPGKDLGMWKSNASLVPSSNVGVGYHYHIFGSTIDLTITFSGASIATGLVFQLVEVAVDNISTNLTVRPSEAIIDGYFRQRHNGIQFDIYECYGKHLTWTILNQLLFGLQYFTHKPLSSRVLEFEIDISGVRSGYGTLRYTHDLVPGSSILNSSQNITSNPSHPLLLANSNDEEVVFSFHSFGKQIPAMVLSNSFRILRMAISNNVRDHPNDEIEGGRFNHSPNLSPVEFSVEVYIGNQLTWLLLDCIVTRIAADRWSRHVSQEFDFEFELHPFEEPYGRGGVRYLAPARNN